MTAPEIKPPSAAIERRVIDNARAWAVEWAAQLRKDGRSASGGWPGTMSEARARVSQCVGGSSVLPPSTFDALIKLSYATAKKVWLSTAQTDGES